MLQRLSQGRVQRYPTLKNVGYTIFNAQKVFYNICYVTRYYAIQIGIKCIRNSKKEHLFMQRM